MRLTIFKLEDYASYLNGVHVAHLEGAQHFDHLTREQFNLLVEMIDSTEDYDWR